MGYADRVLGTTRSHSRHSAHCLTLAGLGWCRKCRQPSCRPCHLGSGLRDELVERGSTGSWR